MRAVNIVTQTNGIGSWTAFRKKVNIIGLVLEEDELKAYFSPDDWDTYEHGTIYSDEGWLASFRKAMKSLCSDPEKIEYTAYSAQGEDYVSLEVPDGFELLI